MLLQNTIKVPWQNLEYLAMCLQGQLLRKNMWVKAHSGQE